MGPEEAKYLIQQAQKSAIGLVLRTNNPKRARERLYLAIRDLGVPKGELQIRASALEDGDLVIVRRRIGGTKQ